MLPILYRDEYLIAIDKPSGLLVHRSDVDRRETRFAVQLLRDQIGRHVYPVHRLDRGTSGVLLFTLDADMTRRLSAQFEEKTIEKTYLAVVRGWPPESGVIDHALSVQDENGRVVCQEAIAQPALTHFRTLATAELPFAVESFPSSRYALVALFPVTGRRHQLRRHMKHMAHPIIGDATHGKGRHNRFFQQMFGCHRLLLACVALRLRHPLSGEDLTIGAGLDESFLRVIEGLNWTQALQRFYADPRSFRPSVHTP